MIVSLLPLLLSTIIVVSGGFGDVNEERSWIYSSCEASQKVQADIALGFAYIDAPKVTVLLDYGTKEAAFHFKESSRCLVAPIDKRMFPGSAGELEMRAADFTFKHSSGDSSKFPVYKLVRNSGNIDFNDHFNQDASLAKIKSDLIVETCEDATQLATASVLHVDQTDIECNSLDKLLCVMNMKICESRQ